MRWRTVQSAILSLMTISAMAAHALAAEGASRPPVLPLRSVTCDFERPLSGWQEPGGDSGIVADPEDARNHVYRIVATRPHHTQLLLLDSSKWPNFVGSCRLKVVSWEGEPPALYVYGRLSRGSFRGVSVSRSGSRGFCWYGQNQRNPTLGTAHVSYDAVGGRWLNVKLACWENHLFGKAWLDGSPEPVWQIHGESPGQGEGRFGVGAWTSPRNPSSAVVLVDDITFQPLTEAALERLKMRVHPRPPFDPSTALPRAGVFQSPGGIGLATQDMAFVFERESGEISHIVHRPSGLDFVSPRDFCALFDISLTKPYEGERMSVPSAEFGEVRVQETGDDRLELAFLNHPSLPLTVRVTASIGEDQTVRLRLQVANESDWAIAGVRFPQIAYRAPLGDDVADDCLILPWSDGSVLPAPGQRSQSRSALYPGHAFTQFSALYDGRAGLYFAAYDSDGHCKEWQLRTVEGRSVEMTLLHRFPELRGEAVATPYDVVFRTFVGDWRDAADIYKVWAKRQPWCAKTLAQRDDISQFLKDGCGVVIVSIQNEPGRTKWVGRDLERIHELAAAYRERTELAHVIVVPYGWENRGTWAGINYLPAVPSNEAWKRANVALKAQGDRSAFMTSGLWWVVKRQRTHNGPAFDDSAQFERLKDMVIHNADGTPWFVDNYEKTTVRGNWRGLSAKLCHGSEDALEVMRRIFIDVARLGVPLISFDQEIGGGQHVPCYRKSHGHPPGYGNWMWTGFRDLCARILEDGRPIEPEFGLFMENASELAIPYMATYWSRQFGEVDHGATGARGVGLFSYLYHEYVTAIGAACVQGQGQQGTRPHPGLRCYVMANNLTRGLIPGPFIHDVPLESSNEWQKTISRAFFSYCKPYARFPEYLVLGISRRPPAIECRDVDLWFLRRDPKGEPRKPGGPPLVEVHISLPSVTAGSFEAADGSVGTVMVNTTAEPQDATLRLDRPAESAALYRADRTEERGWDSLPAGAEIPISLEPYGTRMLVVR